MSFSPIGRWILDEEMHIYIIGIMESLTIHHTSIISCVDLLEVPF